jgi:hypothetical protein
LQVAVRSGQIVEEQHRASASGEELLEGEDLPPVTQRIAGEQPQLRQRVEHEPPRFGPTHLRQDRCRRVRELYLGGMEHCVLLFGPEAVFGGHGLVNCDAFERPAVRRRNRGKLLLRLREGHIQHRLALPRALEQVLHGECRLARAGHPFDEVDAVADEAPAQYPVQADDAGGSDGIMGLSVSRTHANDLLDRKASTRIPCADCRARW